MTTPLHRAGQNVIPDLRRRLERPKSMLRPLAGQPIRVETYVAGSRYVVRAELPGVDPAKQVELTIAGGVLSIHAERRAGHGGRYHSEFRYGAFSRQLPLPETADAGDVRASYERGVLSVSIGLGKKAGQARRIPVRRGG